MLVCEVTQNVEIESQQSRMSQLTPAKPKLNRAQQATKPLIKSNGSTQQSTPSSIHGQPRADFSKTKIEPRSHQGCILNALWKGRGT